MTARRSHTIHTGRSSDGPSIVPRGLGWFRPFYVACITALSAVSLREARGPHDHHAWLAGVEIVGALLLLMPRSRRTGLVLLLLVYGVATALTVRSGQVPFHLVLYAGTAIFLAQFRSIDPHFRAPAASSSTRGRITPTS